MEEGREEAEEEEEVVVVVEEEVRREVSSVRQREAEGVARLLRGELQVLLGDVQVDARRRGACCVPAETPHAA